MLRPGGLVGTLRIDSLLGRGAMGEVFRATQVTLKRPVAVKRIAEHLLSTPEALARFEREAQCLARVQSPYVIGVHDFGVMRDEDGMDHFLLVMELVEGGRSLRSCIQNPLRWDEATALVWHVARGLAAAAEFGVIHRDVKPHNIMVSPRGIAKLADFGLARSVDSTDLTTQGSVLGTPAYMPPEACRGEVVDGRGDLYALGVTWFQLLCGRTPFLSDNTPAMLRAHVDDPPPRIESLVPQLPPAIAQLVHRLLEKNPRDRPANALLLSEMIRTLTTQGLAIPEVVILPPLDGIIPDPATAATHVAASAPRDTATIPLVPRPMPGFTIIQPPPTQIAGSAATAATLSGSGATPPRRAGRWRYLAGVAVLALAVALVLGARSRSFDSQKQPVLAALASGNQVLALRLADDLVARFPSDDRALVLDGQVISQEIDRSLAQDGVAVTRELLAQRQAGRDWLDHEALSERIDLHEAQSQAQSGNADAAMALFSAVLARHPNDPVALGEVVAAFPQDSGNEAVVGAAVHLGELQTPVPAQAVALIEDALWRWDATSPLMLRARTVALKADPTLIAHSRAKIDSGDENNTAARFAAFAVLNQAQALTATDHLRYAVVNLCQLSGSFEEFRTGLDWMEATSRQPGWTELKRSAGISPFTQVAFLGGWLDEFSTRALALLATAFVPEITTALPHWLAAEDPTLRYNAWLLAHQAGLAGHSDDLAFHARTLLLFDPDGPSPSLDAALAYFTACAGTPRQAAALRALRAGEAHVQAELKLYDANLASHAPYVRRTLATVHAVTQLLQGATPAP